MFIKESERKQNIFSQMYVIASHFSYFDQTKVKSFKRLISKLDPLLNYTQLHRKLE